jgi:hypothetical protein
MVSKEQTLWQLFVLYFARFPGHPGPNFSATPFTPTTQLFKGIVSRDFEVCFWYRWIAQTLLPLPERVRLQKKVNFVSNF